MKKTGFTLVLFLLTFWVKAQELNCRVTLNYSQMKQTSGGSVDKQYFNDIEKAISTFINTQRWTSDYYNENEKIKCNLLINLMNTPAQNVFEGQAQFQVIRPVFNSTYESVILQYVDNEFNFSFAPEDRQMIFNEFNFSNNLTSMLSYYSLMAIGFDADSFAKMGGTPYYERAFNVCNLAGSVMPKTYWTASSDTRSRYNLVENIRNPIFNDFREGFYNYHRLGLDDLGENPDKSRKIMLEFIQSIKKTATQKPNSIVINSLFDAKYQEFINVFSEASKEDRALVYSIVTPINAKNIDKYRILLK